MLRRLFHAELFVINFLGGGFSARKESPGGLFLRGNGISLGGTFHRGIFHGGGGREFSFEENPVFWYYLEKWSRINQKRIFLSRIQGATLKLKRILIITCMKGVPPPQYHALHVKVWLLCQFFKSDSWNKRAVKVESEAFSKVLKTLA